MHWSVHHEREQHEAENVAMTSIDYEKANDIVPNSRKVDYLLMYKISNKVIKFISKAIIKWDIELTVGKKKTLAEVKSREVIFKGDDLVLFGFMAYQPL